MVAGNLIANNNADFFAVIGAAGAVGALVAMVVGVPALRIRGLFLAVTTLAFAIALDNYFLNQNTFPQFVKSSVKRPLLWERFDLNDNYHLYLVTLSFLALSILVSVGVRKARSGRVLIGTRDNQRAADAASVPDDEHQAVRLPAGRRDRRHGRRAERDGHPGPERRHVQPVDSITVFSTAVIGGLGSITGAIIGVLLFKYLETLTWLGDLRLAINGVGLLVVLYLLPGGLGQLLFAARDKLLRRVADRRGILVPSLVADKRVEDGEDKPSDEVDLLRGALAGAPAGAGK